MNARLQVYRTGLCATSDQQVIVDRRWWPSLRGAGFSFEFRPHVPTEEQKAAAKTFSSLRLRKGFRPPEIHIVARTFERANSAALLLYAAHTLVQAALPGGFFLGWAPYSAIPTNKKELAELWPHDTPPQTIHMQSAGMVDVAGLAARLSRRYKWSEAAYFYLASVYLVNVDSIELRPGERDAAFFQTPYLMHRVWEAQSLFAAFQAIEALDLAIKGASPNRPSVSQGNWDPAIRADLEARLGKIGISRTQTITWAVRGRRSGLHPKLQERTSESSPTRWTYGDIRDENIPFVDAINRAHWLRSNVSAHRSTNHLAKIVPLDALNVQHLARLLIMNAARFPWWNKR